MSQAANLKVCSSVMFDDFTENCELKTENLHCSSSSSNYRFTTCCNRFSQCSSNKKG